MLSAVMLRVVKLNCYIYPHLTYKLQYNLNASLRRIKPA